MKRKNMKHILAGIMAFGMVATSVQLPQQQVQATEVSADTNKEAALTLRYDEPAGITSYSDWEEWSLPIGNSGIGASVFGGVTTERIQLNEKSLWSGGPSDSRPNYNGGNIATAVVNGETKTMAEIVTMIQEAFAAGDTTTATSLCNKLVGVSDDAGVNGYGYYLSYGNMYLDFDYGTDSVSYANYERTLDLRTAVAGVQYDVNGTTYTRENFISYPDNVLVTRITSNKAQAIDMEVRVEPDNVKGGGSNNPSAGSYTREWETTVADGLISIGGDLDDNQMQFVSHTQVLADGKVVDNTTAGTVSVEDAQTVTIITSIGTDYKNDYPVYRTGETLAQVSERVLAYVTDAKAMSYETLKANHIEDYDNIFGRVELDLGQGVSDKTTDVLLSSYNSGTASEAERRQLEVMLFQYGRYLTIQSSRETPEDDPSRETLPSNLQGIWVGANNSAWHSDYHMNVNLQMNYWPTYSTNMAECAEPLIDYVDSLREPGRVTAEIYAGVKSEEGEANGFMAHTQNNPFGWTCPGWSFSWGWSPAAVPWILQNCWEHYEYTGDLEYMRENIYPMLKEEAILYDQMLIEDEDGKLVSSPSYSPEHGPYTSGNTYEQTLIWQLYEDVVTAAELLGVDEDLVAKWKSNQANLKGPIEIGEDGQIKEWYTETTLNTDEDGNTMGQGYSHRHISHMLGLFPGDLVQTNEEWVEAARVSMENRTDESTGWGMGQRINTWARLGDGDKAYELIGNLFKKGILTNLWDTHAPYQIDGNFGYTSGVSEMLIQSNMGYINLLAAMPETWADGSVEGLVARGNFEIDMTWTDGSLTEANILSQNGGEAVVDVENASYGTVTDSKGKMVAVTVISEDRISFNTVEGETYTLSNVPAEETIAAPTGLEATRMEALSTELTWDAVEGEGVVYNVYRQIEDGDVVAVATGLTSPSYRDTTANEILGDMTYQVSVVVNGVESVLSSAVAVNDLRAMVGMIDDRDSRIVYTGAWGDWSQSVNYAGTVKYLQNPTGGETATLTFVGTGIEVIVCTNYDRGQYEVFIDGVSYGTVDTYSSSTVRQKLIYSKTDLEYGKHTIQLVVTNVKNASSTNTKVELDAFNVLNNNVTKPTSVSVASQSGMTTVATANSSLQMEAIVAPADAMDKSVTWSVSNSSLASIDEHGLLTVNGTNGTVTVTATSNADSSLSATQEIVIAIAGEVQDVETIVDEATPDETGTSGTKNEDITWSGTWSVWAGEREKHYGGSKTETGNGSTAVGSYFEYTFTGTGVEIYVQKHANFSSFDVYVDNEKIGNYSFEGSSSGDPQSLLFSKTDLTNAEHTIKCVVVERSGKYQANLDYIKVFAPGEAAMVDKSALQTVITEAATKVEKAYTAATWAEFAAAYQTAVAAMNNSDATAAQVTEAATTLTAKMGNLTEAEVTAPVLPLDAKVEVLFAESTKVTVQWSAVEDAVKYQVTCGETTVETENLYYTLSGLAAGTKYTIQVKAIGETGLVSSGAMSVDVTTTVQADTQAPEAASAVRKVAAKDNALTLSWTAAASQDVAGYEVWMNGQRYTTVQTTQVTVKELVEGQNYVFAIVAIDQAGNKAIPAQLAITFANDAEEVHTHTWNQSYTSKKATTKANGSIVQTCKTCGETKTVSTIYKIASVSVANKTYNGKAQKTTIVVKDSKGKTIDSTNYTVKYASGRKKVGKYKVTITFKGNYEGSVSKYFTINPKATSFKKAKAAKKAITLKWKKQSTQVTGYQIQYCTSKKFKSGTKNIWVKHTKTTSKTIKSLKAKKTYYVRIRTYKTVNKVKYYSAWSAVKKVKTK